MIMTRRCLRWIAAVRQSPLECLCLDLRKTLRPSLRYVMFTVCKLFAELRKARRISTRDVQFPQNARHERYHCVGNLAHEVIENPPFF